MRARVGFGFVTWPQNSEHLERGMLMKAVGMWDCSGLFVLPALNEDRFHFLSGVISPGRSRAGSWDFLPVCTAYHKNIKKTTWCALTPAESHIKKRCVSIQGFPRRKQFFCTWHTTSEKIAFCIVQFYIPAPSFILHCEVSSAGRIWVMISDNEPSQGQWLLQQRNVCLCLTALESKTNFSCPTEPLLWSSKHTHADLSRLISNWMTYCLIWYFLFYSSFHPRTYLLP